MLATSPEELAAWPRDRAIPPTHPRPPPLAQEGPGLAERPIFEKCTPDEASSPGKWLRSPSFQAASCCQKAARAYTLRTRGPVARLHVLVLGLLYA